VTEAECSASDIADATGELVNIVAGGIKCALDRRVAFEGPRVDFFQALGQDNASRVLTRIRFNAGRSSFLVTISENTRCEASTGLNRLNQRSCHALT
jgi:hypothetical protein